MKLPIYNQILIVVIVAVALYLCERHGYNRGFKDALSVLDEEQLESLAERMKTDIADHQGEHIRQTCETCKYQIFIKQLGKFECSNRFSPSFDSETSMDDSCDEWEKIE